MKNLVFLKAAPPLLAALVAGGGEIWAQSCGGGCCAGETAKAAKPDGAAAKEIASSVTPTLAFPLKGTDAAIPEDILARIRKALPEDASAEFDRTDSRVVRVGLKRGTEASLAALEAALEGSPVSVDRERFVLTGRVRLKVSGMTCGGCAKKLTSALENVKHVNGTKVDLKSPREGYATFALARPTETIAYPEISRAVAGTAFRLEDVLWAAQGCCGSCGPEPCCGACDGKDACCGNCGPDPGPGDCCGACGAEKKPSERKEV